MEYCVRFARRSDGGYICGIYSIGESGHRPAHAVLFGDGRTKEEALQHAFASATDPELLTKLGAGIPNCED